MRFFSRLPVDRAADLDPVVQVARHQVGRGDVDFLVAAVMEHHDPWVLEETVNDADGLNIVAQTGHAGLQAAHATDDNADFDPGLAGLVQLHDAVFIGQAVEFEEDFGLFSLLGVFDFVVDQPLDPSPGVLG